MKKKILLALMLFAINNAKAQTEIESFAGINLGNIYTKIRGEKQDGLKPGVGYIAGAHVGFTLGKMFIFQTGLEFESIHRKVKSVVNSSDPATGDYSNATYSDKFSLTYINIPLKLYLKKPTRKDGFRIGFGPFIGFGIGGKNKHNDVFEESYAGVTATHIYNNNEKVKFGSKDNEVKMINIGLGLHLNYLFPCNINIGFYEDIGLIDINNTSTAKTTTVTLGLTVGYMFKSKARVKSK